MHTSRNGSNGSSRRASSGVLPDATVAPPTADRVGVLFRHKWKAILFFTVTMCLTVAAVVIYPRKYLSEAKLFVRVGRETATLDPTATTGHIVTVQNSREREMNSVREILESRWIVEQAVDSVGVDTILKPSSDPTFASRMLAPLKRLKRTLDDLDPITDRERAILRVEKQIRFNGRLVKGE